MLDKLQAIEERYEQLGNELLEVGSRLSTRRRDQQGTRGPGTHLHKGARIPSGNEKP